MRECVCGQVIDDRDTVCAECGALQVLGLSRGATLNEVKAAYRVLVKVWHPDRFQGDEKLAQTAEIKLMAINTAFSYLTSAGYKGGARNKGEASPGSAPGQDAVSGASAQKAAADGFRAPEQPKRPVDARAWHTKRRRGTVFSTGLAIRLLVLLVVAGIGMFLLTIADSYLANDTRVGRYYTGLKSQVSSDFDAAWQRTWGDWTGRAKSILGSGSGSASGTVSGGAPGTSDSTATAQPPAPVKVPSAGSGTQAAIKKGEGPLRLRPYVTLGLTRDEVVDAQGLPTSSSEDKLMYGASELELKDGKVVGWRIDPRSPLRVKLWPEGPVDTSLRSFGVGSTKDEVLVVQGTPTSFTENRFEYGASAVYFRDERVVAWKEGAGSVRLRTKE